MLTDKEENPKTVDKNNDKGSTILSNNTPTSKTTKDETSTSSSSTSATNPSVGLPAPSDDIAARRAVRIKARKEARAARSRSPHRRAKQTFSSKSTDSTSESANSRISGKPEETPIIEHQISRNRPMVRTIQRIRSKSLTAIRADQPEKRVGKKPSHQTGSESRQRQQQQQQQQPSSPSKAVDDLQVGRRRGSLLCGFPTQPSVASLLPETKEKEKRGSLLRGFAPQPPPEMEEEAASYFATTFRGWIG